MSDRGKDVRELFGRLGLDPERYRHTRHAETEASREAEAGTRWPLLGEVRESIESRRREAAAADSPAPEPAGSPATGSRWQLLKRLTGGEESSEEPGEESDVQPPPEEVRPQPEEGPSEVAQNEPEQPAEKRSERRGHRWGILERMARRGRAKAPEARERRPSEESERGNTGHEEDERDSRVTEDAENWRATPSNYESPMHQGPSLEEVFGLSRHEGEPEQTHDEPVSGAAIAGPSSADTPPVHGKSEANETSEPGPDTRQPSSGAPLDRLFKRLRGEPEEEAQGSPTARQAALSETFARLRGESNKR